MLTYLKNFVREEEGATMVEYGLMVALIAAAWVTQHSAQVYGFQPLTLVLLAWGCFQIAVISKKPLAD
jgi:Flp pilus assembly pilin Flp